MIDWRGQGLSDRHPANPMLGHVEDFRDYQRDVAALLDLVDRLDLPGAALPRRPFDGRLHRPAHPARAGGLRGAIFSAPMWHLQMRAATRELTAR